MEDDFARVEVSRYETKERAHARRGHRTYDVLDAPAGLPDARRWKGLKRIIAAISRTVRGDDVRYFIMCRRSSPRRHGTLVRSRWGFGNSLHWQLDVYFGEDQRRTRKDHAAANLGGLSRTALSPLKTRRARRWGSRIDD